MGRTPPPKARPGGVCGGGFADSAPRRRPRRSAPVPSPARPVRGPARFAPAVSTPCASRPRAPLAPSRASSSPHAAPARPPRARARAADPAAPRPNECGGRAGARTRVTAAPPHPSNLSRLEDLKLDGLKLTIPPVSPPGPAVRHSPRTRRRDSAARRRRASRLSAARGCLVRTWVGSAVRCHRLSGAQLGWFTYRRVGGEGPASASSPGPPRPRAQTRNPQRA